MKIWFSYIASLEIRVSSTSRSRKLVWNFLEWKDEAIETRSPDVPNRDSRRGIPAGRNLIWNFNFPGLVECATNKLILILGPSRVTRLTPWAVPRPCDHRTAKPSMSLELRVLHAAPRTPGSRTLHPWTDERKTCSYLLELLSFKEKRKKENNFFFFI